MTDQGPEKTPDKVAVPDAPSSFFAELKKRRVYRVAVAYAVVAWGGTEILDGVISRLGWPDWLATLAVIVFVVGFPVAMFLAWVFDWTSDGIRRTEPWTAAGWLSIVLASVFLVIGSTGLFWLINPSGVARLEQTGIAVLPCRYHGEPEFAFRGEGLADVLNEQLAHSRQLFVPAFGSVLKLAARNLETAELAGRLHVTWLVECRVTQQNGRLSIDVGIVDVSTDESEALVSQDVESFEMFGVLDMAGEAILSRFGLSPARGAREQIAIRYPPSVRAFDSYLKGEQSFRIGTAEALRESRGQFEDAQIVEGFNLARIREADTMMALIAIEPPTAAARLTAALKAVGLILDQAGLGEYPSAELYAAKLRLANLLDQFDPQRSATGEQRLEWFEAAVGLKPNYVDPYRLFADYLVQVGRRDEATVYRLKAEQLDPACLSGS